MRDRFTETEGRGESLPSSHEGDIACREHHSMYILLLYTAHFIGPVCMTF